MWRNRKGAAQRYRPARPGDAAFGAFGAFGASGEPHARRVPGNP